MPEWDTECGVHHGLAMATGAFFSLAVVAILSLAGLSKIEVIYGTSGMLGVLVLAGRLYEWWQPPKILDEYESGEI